MKREAKKEFKVLNKKIGILIWIILLLSVGCGQKAPPVPWETIVPKRIVDLEALPREGGLLLGWTTPRENTDKTPLVDLAEFRVLRSEGSLIGDECRGCGEKFEVVYEMKLDGKEEARGKKMTVFFETLTPQKVYVYQVVSINRKGHPGSPSNPVTVFWDHPPLSPERVRGESGDQRVDLTWDGQPGVAGYNVYRRTEGERFPIRPLNRELLKVTQFTDLSVENEKKYLYTVRAIRRVVKTDLEGKGSLDVPMAPTDLIPPGAPTGLVAIPLRQGMELNWRRNREPDLFGYHVYRRTVGEKEFKRLNDHPVTKETYLDSGVEIGQDYEYSVTAVDHSPRKNESPLSEEVRVKYLY